MDNKNKTFQKTILYCKDITFPDKPECCEDCHKEDISKAFTFNNPAATYKVCCNVASYIFREQITKRL